MALRLGPYVEFGELYNKSPYSVHGVIKFWGCEQPVYVELTGNFSADLAGKQIRFEARPQLSPWSRAQEPAKKLLRQIAMHQVGATGTMTAARRVRVPELPAEEFAEAYTSGAALPATTHRRCLYLEWFSQNGRVVVELVDPLLQTADEMNSEGEAEWVELAEAREESADGGASCSPGQRMIELDEHAKRKLQALQSQMPQPPGELCSGEAPESAALDAWLAELASEADQHAAPGISDFDPDDPQSAVRECELMDDLLESDSGVSLRKLLGRSVFEYDLEQLGEEQAEGLLKCVLARLALYGIGLHMCEHFTPRQALQLLLDQLGRDSHPYPALRGTGWVTNYMTAEYCPACEARTLEEFEKHKG